VVEQGAQELVTLASQVARRAARTAREMRSRGVGRVDTKSTATDVVTAADKAVERQIIADLRAQRISYQEFLKRVAQLAKKLVAGQEQDTPEQISTRGLRALYSNLGQDKELAVKIDEAVKKARPADWRSTQAKRLVVKQTLWNILQDADEVERIFRIIERHEEY